MTVVRVFFRGTGRVRSLFRLPMATRPSVGIAFDRYCLVSVTRANGVSLPASTLSMAHRQVSLFRL